MTNKTREEIDLKRLLSQCELMVKSGLDEEEWRLKKYLEKAESLLAELKTKQLSHDSDSLLSYSKRINFLSGMSEVFVKSNNPLEKMNAISKIPNIATTEDTKVIYHKELQKVQEEIRDDLFTKKSELRMRTPFSKTSLPLSISDSPSSSQLSPDEDSTDMNAIMKYHHSMQEKIADNMVSLAKSMKEQSLIANSIIKNDTKRIEDSTLLTDKNILDLKKNSDKLQEHTKSNWQCWIWLLLAIVLMVFIGMVMVMKLFKKRM